MKKAPLYSRSRPPAALAESDGSASAAASVGAGISMAFSEGLSDDGELTGRGNPVFRGLVTGGMTFVGEGDDPGTVRYRRTR